MQQFLIFGSVAFTFFSLMLAGTFFLGAADTLKKKYLNEGMDENVLLSFHLILAGAILFLAVLMVGLPSIGDNFWPALIATVSSGVVAQSLFMRALAQSPISLVSPLRIVATPLTIISGYFVLGEAPSIIGVLGISITIVGVWYLVSPSVFLLRAEIRELKYIRGIGLALLSTAFFALSFPFDKQAVAASSPLFATSLILLCLGATLFLAHFIFEKKFQHSISIFSTRNIISLFIISLPFATGALFTTWALLYSFAAYASSVKRLQVLWVLALSGAFLHEEGMAKKFIAACIMLAGIAITVLWH